MIRIDARQLGVWITVIAMTAAMPALGARAGIGVLADTVLARGLDGRLPPNLSLALGIGTGDALAVKQAVIRDGFEVRVLNVCTSNHANIVILRTDEQAGTTDAYLVSATGKLRKAVSYHAGGQPQVVPPRRAKSAVKAEIRFWTHLEPQRAPNH